MRFIINVSNCETARVDLLKWHPSNRERMRVHGVGVREYFAAFQLFRIDVERYLKEYVVLVSYVVHENFGARNERALRAVSLAFRHRSGN